MKPILLSAKEEARLVVTAALPLTPGHPPVALSTASDTWFDAPNDPDELVKQWLGS